jgi:hypothetical protein
MLSDVDTRVTPRSVNSLTVCRNERDASKAMVLAIRGRSARCCSKHWCQRRCPSGQDLRLFILPAAHRAKLGRQKVA